MHHRHEAWNRRGSRSRWGRRHWKRRRGYRDELTPEQQLYRNAERRAQRKVSLVKQGIAFGMVMLLAVATRGFGTLFLLIGLGWGLALAMQSFSLFVAPSLRDRWVRQAVQEQVQEQMSQQRRVLQDEKLRSLEELSASIAHEIRNPITAAKSLVQQMGEDPASRENVEYAAVALEELERVERSVSHLLRYARDESIQRRPMRIEQALDDALEVLDERIDKLGVVVHRDFDPAGELEADYDMVRRLFLNLFQNALDAFEEAGTPSPQLEVSLGESLSGQDIWVRVRDNGPGMDEATRERLFRPFFTSKANGTGLGLAVCRKLVQAHGGQIEVETEPGSGTAFELTLPRTGLEATA